MLKYHQIIKNLTEEEKIKLIVSNEPLQNGNIANFNLPIINVDSSLKSCDTQHKLPSYNTICYTWNLEVVKKVGFTLGKQNLYAKNDKTLGLNTYASAEEKFSTDRYLTARMVNSCLEGMNRSNAFSTVVNMSNYESKTESEVQKEFLPFDFVMSNKENHPSAVYVSSLHDVDYLRNKSDFSGLIMCEVKTPEELVKAFNKKCHVIVYQEDAVSVILPLLEGHKAKKDSLTYGEISNEGFEGLKDSGAILNPEVLDEILDELLDHLASFDDKICSFEHKLVVSKVNEEVARESIVLLHNNGLLPISPKTSVCLLGKPFFESEQGSFKDKTIAEYFQKHDIKVVYAANGYEEGLTSNDALVKITVGNTESANTTIVYLKQNEELEDFSAEQIELITELSKSNRRVVAFVEGKYPFNFEILKNCAAVLFMEESFEGFAEALIDIITGVVTPSGRLSKYLPKDKETLVDSFDPTTYAFPLGYGLTYSDIKYSNLKVYNLGVTVTLKNDSLYIVHEVPQLYISTLDKHNNVVEKELRGFKKVTLHPKECVSVTIPFDKYTFSTYNSQYGCNEIKAGTYKVTVANNAASEGLTSEVKLGHKLYNGLNEDLEIKFVDSENFNADLLKEDVANKGLSYKAKLGLSITSLIYFNIVFIISLGYNLLLNNVGTVIGIIILLIALNVGVGYYIKKIVKHRRLYGEKYVKPALTFNTMLNDMGSFKEVAKVTYYEPVKEEVVQEEEVEEVKVIEPVLEETVAVETKPEEEVDTKVYTGDEYNVKYTSNITFDTEISFEEYVRLFSSFVSSRGIIIEPKSARVLLSSLFSTRLLILRSPSKELLPKFKELLSEFFDDKDNRIDMNTISTSKDLIWTAKEDSYVRTEFVKFLYRTKSLKRHFSICDLDNVDVTTLTEKLGEIYKYIKNPNDLYQINIGNEEMPELYTIPKNLYFIATTNDEEYLENIDKDLAEHSLSLELMLRENEIPSVEEVMVKYISTTRMSLMLKEFKDNQFLSEKEWKKFDDLEEGINDMSSFRIENKSVLDFEKMAALMLNCDGTVDEVLDLMLASRLVPVLKSNPIYLTKNGDKTLYTMMEKIFGEDSIPMTKRAMVKNN